MLISSQLYFAQTEFEVEIFNVVDIESPSENLVGEIHITYTPGDDVTFLSIGAQDEESFEFGMILENLYLPTNSEVDGSYTIAADFNLSDLSTNFTFENKKELVKGPREFFTLFFHLFPGSISYDTNPSNHVDTKEGVQVTTKEIEISNGITYGDPGENIDNNNPPQPDGDVKTKSKLREDIPVIDLDKTTHGPTSNYAGDQNACVPASTSNSIMWMAAKYPDDFKLPPGLTHRQVLEGLSGSMNRLPNQGVVSDQLVVKGKLDYFENNNINNVEVKFQSQFVDGNIPSSSGKRLARNYNTDPNKHPTWEFLTKMICDGEDVQIGLQEHGGIKRGHHVTVSGFEEYQSGKKRISIVDDQDQSNTDPGQVVNKRDELTELASGRKYITNGGKAWFITGIFAESPYKLDGSETAALLGELFGFGQKSDPFIEIALNEDVTDLENYLLTIYNGGTGLSHQTISLDNFNAGSNSNGFISYFYNLSQDDIPGDQVGLALSHTGSVIEYQFVSVGGEFLALDGDATQRTSYDLGPADQGNGFALNGFSEAYSGFYWINTPNASPGDVNEGQTYTPDLPTTPELISPANGSNDVTVDVTFEWDESQLTNFYSLEIATDVSFTNIVVLHSEVWGTASLVNELAGSTEYFWRVKAINGNGESEYSTTNSFTTIIVGIDDGLEIPIEYSLKQNYPNPFNPTTAIKFSLPENGLVKLSVYNSLGEEVAILLNKYFMAGQYEQDFNAADLPTGIYIYRISVGQKFNSEKKMILLK